MSVHGCLAVLTRIYDLVLQDTQFVVANHSPILLAVPGARILYIDGEDTITPVICDGAPPVELTRSFLAAPERYLRHLLNDE